METKIFEIRDRATFMPVMAIRLKLDAAEASGQEFYLLRRAGYAGGDITRGRVVILMTLSGGRGNACCDPYDWRSDTLTPAHAYITQQWDKLRPGQVIDAEFIRGESAVPKLSEAITNDV